MTDPAVVAYATIVVLLAYVVRGLAGFGSGLIAVPLLSMVAPVPTVVPVLASLDYVGSAAQSVHNVGRVAWREILTLLPFSLVGVVLGIVFLRSAPTAVLSRSLGAFVVVYAIYRLLPTPPFPNSRFAAIVCGLFGGLIGTLFGTGGPFYAIYFTVRGLDKSAFRATFSANFLIDGGLRIAAYALAGFFGWQMLQWFVVGLPVMAVGIYIGGRLHVGLSQRDFVRLVSVILLASGITLLLRR